MPVPDDEGHEPPADPPAEDPDNTGDTDDPSDGEITDPDAAATAGAGALAFAPLIPWFIGTRRKLRENA
ncbi:hypothetical protein B7Y92_02135 [Candidatus Saccharibacteria bacterium 32-50-13]|nr:MAG: hypothetical protein B7Y92_02135 [Candidatus Saccharibacteria bacterium 32-50-13]